MVDRRSIQRFEVLDTLGSGGMGTVYRARDPQLDRSVAIKVLNHARLADDPNLSTARTVDLRDRGTTPSGKSLFHEARIMARLSHPNIVPIYEIGLDEADVFVVMEHVDGASLREWLKQPRQVEEILAVFGQAGRGLEAAHDRGIVHRDFKPDNVLIGTDGRVRVMDFGVAQLLAPGRAASSPTGGTPRYMAPELFDGAEGSTKSDVYAFAVSLVEALGGDARDDEPGALERLVRGRLRRRLADRVLAALAEMPASRPAIGELVEALEGGGSQRVWIAAVGAIAAASIGVAVALGTRGESSSTWQPQIVDLPTFEENNFGLAVSWDSKLVAYSSDRERAGKFRIFIEPLRGGKPRAITPLGMRALHPRWVRDGSAVLFVLDDEASERIARVSVDGGAPIDLGAGQWVDDCGDVLVVVENEPPVDRLTLVHRDGSRRTLLAVDEKISNPQCDRAGERIVFSQGGVLKTIEADIFMVDRRGTVTRLTHDGTSAFATFTPDGGSIVFASMHDQKTQLYEMPSTGGTPRQLTFLGGIDRTPDVAADGTIAFVRKVASWIVVGGFADTVRKVSARQEMIVRVVPTHDGTRLVAERMYTLGSSDLVIIDAETGDQRPLTAGQRPFLSLDERRVYFRASEDHQRLDVISIDGGKPTTVGRFPFSIVSGVETADGVNVELEDGDVRRAWRIGRSGPESEGVEGAIVPAPGGGWRANLVPTTAGFEVRLIPPGGTAAKPVRTVVATRGSTTAKRVTWLDDTHLAYAAADGFHVIDVTTGVERAKVPTPTNTSTRAVLARDGKHWFDLQDSGHATRHLLVNFADRPWR